MLLHAFSFILLMLVSVKTGKIVEHGLAMCLGELCGHDRGAGPGNSTEEGLW